MAAQRSTGNANGGRGGNGNGGENPTSQIRGPALGNPAAPPRSGEDGRAPPAPAAPDFASPDLGGPADQASHIHHRRTRHHRITRHRRIKTQPKTSAKAAAKAAAKTKPAKPRVAKATQAKAKQVKAKAARKATTAHANPARAKALRQHTPHARQAKSPQHGTGAGAHARHGGNSGSGQSGASPRNPQGQQGQDQKNAKPHGKGGGIFKNPLFKIGVAVLVLLLIAGGVAFWLIERNYEDTDDAFIDTHIIHVAPQVAGQVSDVAVNDNDAVQPGQVLVRIDPADAETHLAQVQAQEAQAEVQLRQAAANMQGAAAQAENAQRDLARYRELQRTTPGAVAQQQLDQAAAAARNLAAQRDVAREQIAAASAQIDIFKAEIAAAQLTRGYTLVTAPNEGHVVQRTVALGDYVVPGQQLLDLVPLQTWVTANFKETQLTRMRIGQDVSVKIDACEATVHGHVDSIQPGAGQAFGLLPPENATGNFVKVVQRVPVKILLDQTPPNCMLGPGMSVEPRVTVR